MELSLSCGPVPVAGLFMHFPVKCLSRSIFEHIKGHNVSQGLSCQRRAYSKYATSDTVFV